MKGLLCDFLLTCSLATQPVVAIDLDYRAALFALYQDHREEALVDALILAARSNADTDSGIRTRLLVAHASAEIGVSTLGGIALDALPPPTSPADGTRSALLRARASYQRHDWGALLEIIEMHELPDRGGVETPAAIGAELDFMHAEALGAMGDFDRAEQLIFAARQDADPHRAYALFNLGVRLRNAGMANRAERILQALAESRVFTEDTLDLKQRGLVALAVLKQQRTESASAEAYLRELPAVGPYRDTVLASFGSLAMEDGDFALAGRVWLTLLRGDPPAAVRETARLAYPLCLEQVSSPTAALEAFRAAEASFVGRMNALRELRRRAEAPSWAARVLPVVAADRWPKPDDVEARAWQEMLGRAGWPSWSNIEAVQDIAIAWRSAVAAIDWLDTVPVEVSALTPIATERRRRASIADAPIDHVLPERLATVEAAWTRTQTRAAALVALEPQRTLEWMTPLANVDQRRQLAMLAELRTRARNVNEPSARSELDHRIDRLEGILLFDLDRDARQAGDAVQAAAAATTDALRSGERQIRALRDAKADISQHASPDFDKLGRRATELRVRADALRARSEGAFRDLALARIESEVAAAERQLRLTRIGIARTTDRVADAHTGDSP